MKRKKRSPELILREALLAVEWIETAHGEDFWNYCPACKRYQHDGHARDCSTARALRIVP